MRPHVAPSPETALRVDVVISKFGGFANELLAKAFHALAPGLGIDVDRDYPAAMTPEAYVNALEHCRARRKRRRGGAGVGSPKRSRRRGPDRSPGIPLITVLTGLPGSGVLGYAGLDNRAAGRTAGLLMGRLCRKPGEVAVFTGGTLYRSHEEREIGIRTVIREEFPTLTILEASVGLDDPSQEPPEGAGAASAPAPTWSA